MNNDKLVDELRAVLLTLPRARLASGGKEVVAQCQECGDSHDKKEAHMYIKLPYDGSLPVFHCFRVSCLASGILTADKLMQWGAYDSETAIDLARYNKQSLSLEKNRKFKDSEVYRLNNLYINDNELSRIKLKYINNRLGLNLSYDDLLKQKIVLNLKDLLETNSIIQYTREPYIIDQLDESFIGFISQDNAFINMRNLRPGKVNKSIDSKYVNYSIFGKFDNTQKYYTLPSAIDLNNPNRIKINIAEGPFDILSIYYNLTNQNNNHNIYSAILGGGYLGICKHFIHNMKLINVEFHVYIDNDVPDYIIYDIAQYLRVYQMPLYLHRNMYSGEKDFGVRKDNIIEQVMLIR